MCPSLTNDDDSAHTSTAADSKQTSDTTSKDTSSKQKRQHNDDAELSTRNSSHNSSLNSSLDGGSANNNNNNNSEHDSSNSSSQSDEVADKLNTSANNDRDDDEEKFDWQAYLDETHSVAAPASCFCQHEVPPANEFRVGHKLETYDPRNTSSMCVGTVIECQGPRIRLRLDGTDDRNDFWLMCDDTDMRLHPFGYTRSHGKFISPPLGYQSGISQWNKFYEKLCSQAASNPKLVAPASAFKPAPPKPLRCEFRVGQKLEAVDPKNPHLICPATVRDIKSNSKLLLSFDGWSLSSQFWCEYKSRDIFPVGWCHRAGHYLQPPGNLLNSSASRTNKRKSLNDSSSNKNIKTPKTGSNKTPNTSSCAAPQLDLSIVKTEPTEELQHHNHQAQETSLDTSGLSGSGALCCIWVNEGADTSKHIKANKFHASHRRFGPGTPAQVFKSVAQSLVDCGHDRHQVFELMPTHKGARTSDCETIKLKTNDYNEKKVLPPVTSLAEVWANLKKICHALDIECSQLFSKTKPSIGSSSAQRQQQAQQTSTQEQQPTSTPISSSKQKQPSPEKVIMLKQQHAQIMPLTPQESKSSAASACSSTNSSASSSPPKAPVPPPQQQQTGETNGSQKRRSSTMMLNGGPDVAYVEETGGDYFVDMSNLPPKIPKTTTTTTVNNVDEIAAASVPTTSVTAAANASASLSPSKLTLSVVASWDVDQVANYVTQMNPDLYTPYMDRFRHHEIDGNALLLLTTDILMKYMGFKLGPALKLNNFLDKLRRCSRTTITNYLFTSPSPATSSSQIQPKIEIN